MTLLESFLVFALAYSAGRLFVYACWWLLLLAFWLAYQWLKAVHACIGWLIAKVEGQPSSEFRPTDARSRAGRTSHTNLTGG